MKNKKIFLVASLGILVLCVWIFSLIPWVEGFFDYNPVTEHTRPFGNFHYYYPREIYLKEQHQKLHIKEMSYKLDDRADIFLKDQSYELYGDRYYDSLAGEYRFVLFGIDQHIKENVNVGKLFKGKKRGDVFKYTVMVVYSVDDMPESIQIIEHNLKVTHGKYTASLFMLIGMIFSLIVPM
jgi:hypothetical protein